MYICKHKIYNYIINKTNLLNYEKIKIIQFRITKCSYI